MDLLFTDTHLDDNPDNEYRWGIFDSVRAAATEHRVRRIFNLGDMWDRKDRFSSYFVNRLLVELRFTAACAPLYILKGNHDTPLQGPAFFEFINGTFENVHYITEPTPLDDLMLLPHASRPLEAWRGIKFSYFRAAFLHVTVTGALSENGIELTGPKLPIFPRGLRLYSGDVHTPQTVKNLTYVGSPHPVKFGDRFPCRMLLLDDDYEIAQEIMLETLRKHVLYASTLDELREALAGCREGDQVRMRFNLAPGQIDDWAEIEAEIPHLLKKAGVRAASTEVTVVGGATRDEVDLDISPEAMLREFAAAEDIRPEMLDVGLKLLLEVSS